MEDVDGNKFVDLIQGLPLNILGYANAEVNDAAYERSVSGHSFSLPHLVEIELAERLCKLIPCAEMVRFGKMALMPPLAPLGWLELIQKERE